MVRPLKFHYLQELSHELYLTNGTLQRWTKGQLGDKCPLWVRSGHLQCKRPCCFTPNSDRESRHVCPNVWFRRGHSLGFRCAAQARQKSLKRVGDSSVYRTVC